jgi:hypothetical protein
MMAPAVDKTSAGRSTIGRVQRAGHGDASSIRSHPHERGGTSRHHHDPRNSYARPRRSVHQSTVSSSAPCMSRQDDRRKQVLGRWSLVRRSCLARARTVQLRAARHARKRRNACVRDRRGRADQTNESERPAVRARQAPASRRRNAPRGTKRESDSAGRTALVPHAQHVRPRRRSGVVQRLRGGRLQRAYTPRMARDACSGRFQPRSV